MANPTELLSSILNVVTATEKNISNINANIKKLTNAAPADTVSSAASGVTGGKTESNNIIVNKLDTIISILTGDTKNKNKANPDLSNIGNAIGGISMGLIRFAIVPTKTKESFIHFIQKLLNTFDEIKNIEKIESGIKILGSLGAALGVFAKNMTKAALIFAITLPLQPLIGLMILGYGKMFEYFNTKNVEISKGVDTFKLMAGGLMAFAGSIAILALTFTAISALVGVGGVVTGVALIALTIYGFSEAIKSYTNPKVEQGVNTFKNIGKGFLYLAGGIAILAITFAAIGELMGAGGVIAGVVGMTLAVLGIGLAFGLIGVFSNTIEKGVNALKDIGIGFLFLSGGIFIMAMGFGIGSKIFDVSPAKLGLTIALAVLGIGLAFGLIGVFSNTIEKGANAFKDIGVGFLFLAGGIFIMAMGFGIASKLFDVSPAELGLTIAISVLSIAGAFWIMGKAKGSIIQGALAVGLIGLSLAVVGFGIGVILKEINTNKTPWEDMAKLGVALTGLGLVFGIAGAPPIAEFILMGAAAFGAIGGALILLGIGLQKFKDLGGFKFDTPAFITLMGGLKDGFLTLVANDSGKSEGGFIGGVKNVVGSFFQAGKLLAGVTAGIGIGAALSSIGMGVGAWARLDAIRAIEGYDKNGNPIFSKETYNMRNAVDNIKTAFSNSNGFNILHPFIDLSNNANLQKNGSILSMLIDTDFGESPFARGVSIAGRIGNVLSSVAAGIGSWGNTSNIPRIVGYDNYGNPKFDFKNATNLVEVIKNINKVFSLNDPLSILSIFKQLGSDKTISAQPEGFSLTKILFGGDFKKSPFEQGVSVIAKIGDILTAFASGISSFANIKKIPTGNDGKTIDINIIASNISSAIKTITTSLSNLAKDDEMMDRIKIVGQKLKYIINPIKAFADLFSSISTSTNGNPKNIFAIGYHFSNAIKTLISTTVESAAKIKVSNLNSLGILGAGLVGFSDVFVKLNNIDAAKIGLGFGTGMKHILTSIDAQNLNAVNIGLFTKFTTDLIRLSYIQDPFAKFVTSFDKMSKSMGTFAKNFSMMSPNSIKSYTELTSSLSNFIKLNPTEFQAKLDMVSKAFGVKENNNTIADNLVESQAGKKMVPVEKPIDIKPTSNIKQTNDIKNSSALISKLDELIMEVKNLSMLINDGITVDNLQVIVNALKR